MPAAQRACPLPAAYLGLQPGHTWSQPPLHPARAPSCSPQHVPAAGAPLQEALRQRGDRPDRRVGGRGRGRRGGRWRGGRRGEAARGGDGARDQGGRERGRLRAARLPHRLRGGRAPAAEHGARTPAGVPSRTPTHPHAPSHTPTHAHAPSRTPTHRYARPRTPTIPTTPTPRTRCGRSVRSPWCCGWRR